MKRSIVGQLGLRLRHWVPLVTACVALFACGSARADLIIAAQNVVVSAGTTGASLDVTLTNTGPGAVGIGGFAFELTVGNSLITFTDVTTATASPYIFDGLGLFGPSLGIVVTGQDILASDLFSVIGAGTTLGAGVTVGLGHLLFDVSILAPSSFNPVTIVAFPATSLADLNQNDVPITALVGGSITLRSVPEPASLLLVGSGLVLAGVHTSRRRRTNVG
jgi:hypothetical protein